MRYDLITNVLKLSLPNEVQQRSGEIVLKLFASSVVTFVDEVGECVGGGEGT